MAQLNITLNQDEILLILQNNPGEGMRQILEKAINSILKVESANQLNAEPYERNEDRTDSRNGTRARNLNTRIGRLTLNVPRHRNVPFKTVIFENYSRSEAALVSTMAEMVVNGVSTRKVSKVIETLCGTSFSKSSVSEVCKDLDEAVQAFQNRPLTGNYPFLTVDATYFKVREKGRIISKAFMTAYAINEGGLREVIGFGTYPKESQETWRDFLAGLKKRGLTVLLLITSDAHEGLRIALNKEFPQVPWQRCQFHFSKNITEKAPLKYQAGIRAELQEMFQCETIEKAREVRDAIIADYSDVAEAAMNCLDEGFDSAMTVMVFSKSLRRMLRTSNHIERLNREMKRRSKVIGIFPNEESIIRLMGSVLLERNDTAQNSKAIFSRKSYDELLRSDVPVKLVLIAEEQTQLLAA